MNRGNSTKGINHKEEAGSTVLDLLNGDNDAGVRYAPTGAAAPA